MSKPRWGHGATAADRLTAAAEIALAAGLGLALVRFGYAVITPAGPLGAWTAGPSAAHATADPAIFGAFDPFFRQQRSGAAAVSDLNLVLLGTRVDMISGRGSAIIATPDGQQASFLVGEDVLPGVRLDAVGFDAITLLRGGRREQIFLDQSTGLAPVTQTPTALPARLAADILLTPRLRGTAITGYTLTPKGSGAAFAAAGLVAGDIVTSVDGAPIDSVRDPASLVQRLDAGGVSIGIERGGRPLTLKINGAPR